MITEKQKCIAEQAVCGDLMLNRRAYDDVEEKYIIEQVDSKWVLDFRNYDKLLSLTPILRPLSDLTKTVTHKGYNDDEPFVPLVELAKINNPEYTSIEINEKGRIFINTPYIEDLTMGYDSNNAIFIDIQISKNGNVKPETSRASRNQQPLFDLLNLWHFDTRSLIKKCEAIDANTLSINPYSVES